MRIFSFLTNSGYATANNIASSVAHGDYLLFLNSDTILDPFCIEHMRSFTLQNKYGIGACLVTDYSGVDRHQCGMNVDLVGYPGLSDSHNPFYTVGCAFLISAPLFRFLEGFDSSYFMYHEEIDLCWRAMLHGHTVKRIPEAKVQHYGGGVSVAQVGQHSFARTTESKRFLAERNRL